MDEVYVHPIFLESRLLSGKNFANAERSADSIRNDRSRPYLVLPPRLLMCS